ncbi:MAG: hypothetical protein IKA02_05195, partial [Clostridia bacterium]|nr:hypothetical protein [Clostridia bacterium]
ISRVGQTEECLVYTFIYSENNEANKGFNKVYYDILADKKGFNLFGKCQTEVSFVVPVVMACMRRLFDKNYKDVNDENFKKDHSEFKAVYKNEYIPVPENVEKFPQMLKYLYDNRDEITIYYTELSEDGKPTGNERVYTGDQNIEAIKLMIQIYSEVLCHETEEDSKKD